MYICISIHVVVRGATNQSCCACCHPLNFNPRTREGCDADGEPLGFSFNAFQSTHPRGVRRGHAHSRRSCIDFNPRTREGCDMIGFKFKGRHSSISIHAPARGATPATSLILWRRSDFNPRTREGCDARREAAVKNDAAFQSTHPRGVRLGRDVYFVAFVLISIHAPARGATQRRCERNAK